MLCRIITKILQEFSENIQNEKISYCKCTQSIIISDRNCIVITQSITSFSIDIQICFIHRSQLICIHIGIFNLEVFFWITLINILFILRNFRRNEIICTRTRLEGNIDISFFFCILIYFGRNLSNEQVVEIDSCSRSSIHLHVSIHCRNDCFNCTVCNCIAMPILIDDETKPLININLCLLINS